jgi:hypothetical protein
MIYGQTSDQFQLFTGFDAKYMYGHAKGFVTSCALAKNNVHLHITNPIEKDWHYLDFLKKGYNILYPEGILTTSYDTFNLNGFSPGQLKTFYTCIRFLVAPTVVRGGILITDIDVLVIHNVTEPNADIGIFLRDLKYAEWNGLAGKVLASAVYCNPKNKDFLEYTNEFIMANEKKWFVDQVALLKAYEFFKDKKYHVYDQNFCDWDFSLKSTLWTGKGDRKSLNAVYTGKHKEFKALFPLKDKEYFNEKGYPISSKD